MLTFHLIAFIFGATSLLVLNVGGTPSPGGFLRNFFTSLTAEQVEGEKTEENLPQIVKEHHYHEYVKKPIYQVQETESQGQGKKQQIVHNHYQHQKVIHKNHHHQHIVHENTQHNVHTHNIHNQLEHIHEHTKEYEHIHRPIYHQYDHHKHRVTNEQVTKNTEDNKHSHAHAQSTSHVHAKPIHEKEWSFWNWLRAMSSW